VVLPTLLDLLGDTDTDIRQEALTVLARMPPEELTPAVPALIDVLGDSGIYPPMRQTRLRVLAAQILGRIGPPARAAVPALKEALDDTEGIDEPAVRHALAQIAPRSGSRGNRQTP
jgi:HEAT repeat protein